MLGTSCVEDKYGIRTKHETLLQNYGYDHHKYLHDYVYNCKVNEPADLATNINKLLKERHKIYHETGSFLTTVIIHGAENQDGILMEQSKRWEKQGQNVQLLFAKSYDHEHKFRVIESPSYNLCEKLQDCNSKDLKTWAEGSYCQRDMFGFYTSKYYQDNELIRLPNIGLQLGFFVSYQNLIRLSPISFFLICLD